MSGGLGRASVVMGIGTMISRVTGLLRNIVLVSVVGVVGSRAGDAFAVANQLPNNIYAILSAGVLTAVIVPQIVKASAADDGGERFISRLFTLGTVVLLGTTALAMLFAPFLVDLSAQGFTPEQRALAIAFSYWCLPQILFYGLYALVGETLNARRIFGPFTWAPIINNVVSIAGFVGIMLAFGSDLTAVDDWTPDRIALLGGLTTLGIAAQAVVLVFFWHRTGLHLRPDFRWRGVGLGNIVRLAGWTTAMVIVGQIAGIVQSNVQSTASGAGASILAAQSVWLVFMLPYSIIVMSIGTAYFTQLSEHATAERHDEVREDITVSIRIIGLLIVGSTAGLMAAAAPASRIFTNGAAQAVEVAPLLIAYLVGLLPLSVLFVLQRTFYAYNDTRTPFVFTAIQGVLVILTALAAWLFVPVELRVAAVALGQSLAIIVQTVLAGWLLHRKLGGIRAAAWMRSVVRFLVAGVPAFLAGWGLYHLLGAGESWTVADKIWGVLGTALIGGVSLIVYGLVLLAMRAPELSPAIATLRRVVRR